MSFAADFHGKEPKSKIKISRARRTTKNAKAQTREEKVLTEARSHVNDLVASGTLGSSSLKDFMISISGHLNNKPDDKSAGMQEYVYISITKIPSTESDT